MTGAAPGFRELRLLKKDTMGTVAAGLLDQDGEAPVPAVARCMAAARWWARPVAWALARRERLALCVLGGVERVPALLGWSRSRLLRSYIEGEPLPDVRPRDPRYFSEGRRLLRAIHRRGVTHNDTHKEANWLVTPDGRPALVDFQLAGVHVRRGSWFRLCRMEDLRHLLKHKRTYCPEALTARERAVLATKSWPARWWRRLVKPGYLVVTRRILGWEDREGA